MLKPRVYWATKELGRRSEDAFGWCRAAGRFALSDGASTSYAGRAWARALCWQFMRDPDFRADWLTAARTRFKETVIISEDDGWSAGMAFERGSFATFLGFSVLPDRIYGYAVGDSVLFVSKNNGRVQWHPPLYSHEFNQDPTLLSTHGGSRDELELLCARSQVELPLQCCVNSNIRLIAATDALAAWAVGDGDERGVFGRLSFLVGLQSNRAFQDFVKNARADGALKVDDCTVLIVEP